MIGGVLGAADGITGKVQEKAVKGGLIGCGVGFAGGFIGGALAQVLYAMMGGGAMRTPMLQQVIARTIAWALAGMFMGIAQGLPGMHGRKVVNGLVGGMVGGIVGGLCFDGISMLVSGASVSRLFGVIAMGGATGAAIGLVEEARKEAWLRVADGPQSGKQFIIYGSVTRIGRDPKMEIVLIKDQLVAPEHCRIVGGPGGYVLEVPAGVFVSVNGQVTNRTRLRKGDFLSIGQSRLVFEDRVAAGPGPGGIY